jgi:hypothetical protein
LLNWTKWCALSASNFIDKDDVGRLDEMWLRKAMDVVGGKRGHVNQSKKRPAVARLLFDFRGGRSMAAILNVLLSLSHWQMT